MIEIIEGKREKAKGEKVVRGQRSEVSKKKFNYWPLTSSL
jgi:hypothetical protein